MTIQTITIQKAQKGTQMRTGQRIRHIKRGTEYEVVGTSVLDLNPDLLLDGLIIVASSGSDLVDVLGAAAGEDIGIQCESKQEEGTIWVLYKALHNKEDADYPSYWIRPSHEFKNRFEF